MKAKLWVLYDNKDKVVATFRSEKQAVEASREFYVSTVKPIYYLTAGQVAMLSYAETANIEGIFQRKAREIYEATPR
jgi:hypothetical protein